VRKILASCAAAVLAALAAGVVTAAPCGPTTCAALSVSTPGASTLLVRPNGLAGPLSMFNLTTGARTAKLPAGILSADGRRFVTASYVATRPGTRVVRYDAKTGARVSTWIVPGPTSHVDAVSASGRYAALVAGWKNPQITIADLERRAVLRTVELVGQWKVDALSRDGSRLYLLQYTDSGGYRVRVDVAGRGLVPAPITDPAEPAPMTGMPWSSVGTADGRWQLTLFVKSNENKTEAFIHALSLDRSVARCIDLQTGAFMAIGRYALVLSPNGHTLYALNPSLGVVDTIDLARRAVVSTVRFPTTSADDRTSVAFGAISRDGRAVYFSAGRGLHAYDTRAHVVRGPYDIGTITGVGVAPSGRTLLVVRADGTTALLNARTGAPLSA
jgi:hypothetical protein